MAAPVRRYATYADVLAAPEHKVAEVLGHELFLSPRPAAPHARASSVLSGELMGPFDRGRGGPGGWHILFEPELHLGSDILVPDLAGWRRERFTLMPVAYFEQAPDWICEVLSPVTAHIDRTKKLPAYLRENVAYAWLIDPVPRTLEVLVVSGDVWTLRAAYSHEDRVRAVPFEAIEIELGALWI